MSKARICRIFNSQKGKFSKKALAVACSAAIGLAGLSGILPAVASTGEDTANQAEFAESTVLFESNYNNVPDYATNRSSPWSATWSTLLAGNAFPQNIDGNGYISYTQNTMHLGVIRLGHDYETTEIGKYNYVEAIPGKTYIIEYDMKICANYFAQKTTGKLAEGWPLGSNSTMEIGVAVANPTASVADMSLLNYKNGTSNYQVFDTYATGTNPDSSKWEGNKDGWVSKKIVYTVPTGIDVSTNKALQIFIGLGNRCAVSFDNIKVTSAGKYTGEVLADEDYSDSSAGCDKKTSFFSKASNDITPVYDPSDTSNKVIQCIKSSSNYSHLYLGADYVIPGFDGTSGSWQESQNRVATQSITVEPGQKYYIKFKYKLTKGEGTTKPDFFDLGIGTITHNTYGEKGSTLDDYGNNKNYDNVSNFITKDTAADTEGWQTYETFYTAESINQTSDGVAKDKLAIICKIENNYYNIYFDDVTVIKISSEKSVVASDSVIYDTEFADASVRSDRSQSDTFGDAYPVVDPLDSDNTDKAVLYNGGYYNNGIIFIGSKMTDANEAKSSAISAKAGASYKVEFSYYVTGKLGNPTGNPLKIGIRVRSTSDNDENTNNAKYYNSYEEEILSINQPEDFSMTGYETVSATVTVPAGTDFSNGDKLGLYLKGQGVNVYIDNITVTELAPVSVKFVVNGESEYKVFGGNNISYSAAEGKSMLWYKDAAMKNSYALGLYNNNGVLGNLEVYGKQVESDAALIVGDVNMDSVFNDGDFNYLKKILLSTADAPLKSEYRTDLNEDNTIDICDLVHIKKFALNTVTDYKINGTALSDYKITGSVVYKPMLEEYLKITFSESSEKEIVIGQNPSEMAELDENEYIVMLDEDGKLYINGGNANAINAAILSFIGHINTGKEINDTYFVDFEYSGGDFPTTLSLAFSEDFSTDFKGAINDNNNGATASYRENWFQTYDKDLSNTTTMAKNGNLVLYGKSYTDEQSGATKYLGGEVNTAKFYSYGYFEIRAKVNASDGICPAFWLTGSRDDLIEYEVDVFECFGKDPQYLKGTLLAHNYPNGADGGKTSTETGFTYEQLPETNTEKGKTYFYNENGWGKEYHTFGLDWQENSITWYIDGVAVLHATPSNAAKGQYVFDKPMRVRLTCYAGRELGGTIGKGTDWKNGNSLIVDYVRIYQYN